jgi:hypothetical protein
MSAPQHNYTVLAIHTHLHYQVNCVPHLDCLLVDACFDGTLSTGPDPLL